MPDISGGAVKSVGCLALGPRAVLLAFGPSPGFDPTDFSIFGPTSAVETAMSWLRLPQGQNAPLELLVARAVPELLPGGTIDVLGSNGATPRFRVVAAEGLADLLAAQGAAPDVAMVGPIVAALAEKALGTLRLAQDPAFAAALLQLGLPAAAVLPGAPQPVASGPDHIFWRLPGPPAEASLLLLSRSRIKRLRLSGGSLLVTDRAGGEALCYLSGQPVPCRLTPPNPQPPPLRSLAGAADPAAEALLGAAQRALVPELATDPAAHRLLADLQLLVPIRQATAFAEPSRPVGATLETAIADHGGGIFVRGWLRDPMAVVDGLALRAPFGLVQLVESRLHRIARPELEERFRVAPLGGAGSKPGFVAHLPEGGRIPVGQWGLSVRLRTGETIEVLAPPALLPPERARDLVLTAIPLPALTPAIMADALAPPLARLQKAVLALPGKPTVITCGSLPERPTVSIIVPLYRNLRYLRHQLATFARDPAMRDAELIYVLDSPEQAADAEHLLRGLALLYRFGLVLVVQTANRGYGAASNAGAAVARAPVLLLLNSDVVPAMRDWLAPLLAAIAGRPLAAVGPRLLSSDGSLQHAGLYFLRGLQDEWYNDHYFKGFPGQYPPALVPREVPAVTGAALCLGRAAFEKLGGFALDYIIGDYEDSDLCLRLRAAGGAVFYEPRAELFHFERQSIQAHPIHRGDVATAYNRRVHHARWDAAITDLMQRPEFALGGS